MRYLVVLCLLCASLVGQTSSCNPWFQLLGWDHEPGVEEISCDPVNCDELAHVAFPLEHRFWLGLNNNVGVWPGEGQGAVVGQQHHWNLYHSGPPNGWVTQNAVVLISFDTGIKTSPSPFSSIDPSCKFWTEGPTGIPFTWFDAYSGVELGVGWTNTSAIYSQFPWKIGGQNPTPIPNDPALVGFVTTHQAIVVDTRWGFQTLLSSSVIRVTWQAALPAPDSVVPMPKYQPECYIEECSIEGCEECSVQWWEECYFTSTVNCNLPVIFIDEDLVVAVGG